MCLEAHAVTPVVVLYMAGDVEVKHPILVLLVVLCQVTEEAQRRAYILLHCLRGKACPELSSRITLAEWKRDLSDFNEAMLIFEKKWIPCISDALE